MSLLDGNSGLEAPTLSDTAHEALVQRLTPTTEPFRRTHSAGGSPAEGLCPMGWGCRMTPDHEDAGKGPELGAKQSWTPIPDSSAPSGVTSLSLHFLICEMSTKIPSAGLS